MTLMTKKVQNGKKVMMNKMLILKETHLTLSYEKFDIFTKSFFMFV